MKYSFAIIISLLLALVILEPWLVFALDPVTVYLLNVLASLIFILIILSLVKAIEKRESEKEIVYLTAHQLSAPLSSMKWFFEMMLNEDFGKINEEQKQAITGALKKNDYLASLVSDLLDTAKFSNGKLILNLEPCDIKDITLLVARFTNDEIDKKKIKFNFLEPSENLPKIMLDKIKIRLAIQNLFDNAVKYTPAGGNIEASLRVRGKYMEFKIKDSGIGIEKRQKAKIFNKFFRGSNAVKQEPLGHGLGLFFVKSIIKAHGGKIWFKAKENQGSSFYFTLPIKKSYNKKIN